MVVDTRARLKPKAAKLLVGHTVVYTDNIVCAEALPDDTPFDLILLDCVGPGCLGLIQTLRARSTEMQRLGMAVVFDPFELESEYEAFSETLRQAGVLTAIPRQGRGFTDLLNSAVNVALFDAWLLDCGPQAFPFDPKKSPPNCYNRFFRRSYLTRFVRAIGGWDAFKRSADWATLRDDPAGRSNVMGFLHRWGKVLAFAPERFWLEAFLVTQTDDETIDPVVRMVLAELSLAVPSEQFSCGN
jgi:hypothetical protein